jgi:N-acetylglucosaminyldiphosphoundecaprenol N-acetyl-beta-D-mannosaminyltransferase
MTYCTQPLVPYLATNHRSGDYGMVGATMRSVPTGEVLAVKIALTDYAGAVDTAAEMIRTGERGYFCFTSVHGLMESQRDAELARILNGATLNLPDGMPIVWALNLLAGERVLRDRVYGPTFMTRACEWAAKTGTPMFLYGGFDDAALGELQDALVRKFPGIVIAGAWSPPHRPLTEDEEREVAARINGSGAQLVWCGISTPKQERWVSRMRPKLQAPVLASVGAAFDFLADRVTQAPSWMQKRGLEWAYRVMKEPRRLAGRYARNNPAFIAAVTRQYLGSRRDARR